jgi:hypothetical protein
MYRHLPETTAVGNLWDTIGQLSDSGRSRACCCNTRLRLGETRRWYGDKFDRVDGIGVLSEQKEIARSDLNLISDLTFADLFLSWSTVPAIHPSTRPKVFQNAFIPGCPS